MRQKDGKWQRHCHLLYARHILVVRSGSGTVLDSSIRNEQFSECTVSRNKGWELTSYSEVPQVYFGERNRRGGAHGRCKYPAPEVMHLSDMEPNLDSFPSRRLHHSMPILIVLGRWEVFR